jgi:hypothetical protein
MERIASLIMMLCVFCISNAANYLTFTAEEDSSTFGIAYNYLTPDVQYSLDGGETWTELAVGDTILLAKKGDKAHIRGYNEGGLGSNGKDNVHFIMTGAIAASGSVMSLIDGIGLSLKIPKESCFWYLFENCTSLTQAPEVPATTLSEWCYYGMFSGCSSLTQAPELPATTLADWCYRAMFSGCTSLTKAPELPATELPDSLFMRSGCCESMFSGCTNLSEISIAFDKWNDNTLEWVADVAPTGTFICPKTLALEYGISRIPEGWTVKYIEDMANYLTFTAEEDSSTFGILNKNNNPDVQYSLDGGETWTALVKGDSITLVHKGDKALLRGDNPEGFSKWYNKYSSFTMTGKIAVSGSVMSLIDGTGETLVVPADYCFYSLFSGCTSLTQAPELPATTLAERCYAYMFEGCTSLTQAPELPATTLADGCYTFMFLGCTSLTQAPELPATTLADGCYAYMFEGCTSLTQVPELPATTLVKSCYNGMFKGCTNLTQAPELPATTLAESCYAYMFEGCTSLTQVPELPATTLADACYAYMFSGCTSLTQAPELPATTLADYCYNFMFKGCTSLTQAPELPATTLADFCYYSMFSGCTSLTQAPELPATTLADACYDFMFSECTNLSEIRVAFVEWKDSSDQEDNTNCWVKNVAQTGTFYCPKALPLEYGLDRIPEGWTVKYIDEGTGVNDAVASVTTVWTDGNTIYVRGAESDIEVYDMLGRLIVSKRGGQENIQISVPQKGIYVVKVGTETHKVELR